MRTLLIAILTALTVLALPGLASAHPTTMLAPTLPTDVTYVATDNVAYHGRFPEHAGTAGGRLSEDGTRYYLTDPRGVYVYDVTTPESPELLASSSLYQTGLGAALAQEDPDTNGEILVVDGASSPFGDAGLTVVDVSEEAVASGSLPTLGTLPGRTDHTWTCVSGQVDGELNTCAYVYGRSGYIVDLTDPTNPTDVSPTWRTAVDYGTNENEPYTHDLTEIRPGLVLTAGSTAILMDTTDPANPREITRVAQGGRFSSLGYHSVEWANGGLDPILVMGTEIAPSQAGSDCAGENSVIETWDASAVAAGVKAYYEEDATFEEAFDGVSFGTEPLDTFDAAGRGIYLDGKAPGHLLYCAHWMELHPDFDGGGRMAVSYYDRGTRFVDIAADGTMAEIGWMEPVQGYSGSAQWISDEVVYIQDYTRGLEVISIDGEATGTYTNGLSPQSLTSNYTPPTDLHPERAAPAAILLLAMAMVTLQMGRRRGRAGT